MRDAAGMPPTGKKSRSPRRFNVRGAHSGSAIPELATQRAGVSIPVYRPALLGNEHAYVKDCLDTGWISSKGPYVSRFEQQFAERIGVAHATAVCNGTAAIHLALVALGIGPGDEVIVPTLTYIAAVNAIAYTGATPVLVDAERHSWQMNLDEARRRITRRTRAILAVHLYGKACDMKACMRLARDHRLLVVEDCAEALGSRIGDREIGTFGHVAAFSFFGNKTITTGEGGMLVTNSKRLAERGRLFKGQGQTPGRQYWHEVIGYNYRMTNVAAAIGLAQLEQLDGFLARKRRLSAWYREECSDLPLEFHGDAADPAHSHWMISALAANRSQRDALAGSLARAGIETRPVFHPAHRMPMYREPKAKYPVAEELADRGLNLPSWPGLTREDVAVIGGRMRAFFGASPRSTAVAPAAKTRPGARRRRSRG